MALFRLHTLCAQYENSENFDSDDDDDDDDEEDVIGKKKRQPDIVINEVRLSSRCQRQFHHSITSCSRKQN